MRLFTKIFLFGMLAFGAAFSVSGYFLLHYSLESSMARETDFALQQYQHDKFAVQSAMLSYSNVTLFQDTKDSQAFLIWQSAPELLVSVEVGDEPGLFGALAAELGVPAAFFAEDHQVLFSALNDFDPSFLDGLSEDTHTYRFCSTAEGACILVGSMLDWEGSAEPQKIFFVTQWDISKTLSSQRTLQQYFLRCYLIAIAAGAALLGALSALLTGPLKRMARAARRMAAGDYGERLSLTGGGEVGELAASFNDMAGAVEEKLGQLARAAREKEDFAANLAHELKTPLTSIIGYADTIYQKELTRDELRKAAWHIWNEGMRLEALSLKLMDLIMLEKQDFPLTQMPAEELLQDVAESLSPLFPQHKAEFLMQAEPAEVMAEYDLLKTLLLNLIDNSLKAGGSQIRLTGHREARGYRIRIEDNGCGMEEAELSRITEAFYMVDKARSRRQHGAGLGLALAERIAGLHGDSLAFQSQKGVGTEVSFLLPYAAQEHETDDATEDLGTADTATQEPAASAGTAEASGTADTAKQEPAASAGTLETSGTADTVKQEPATAAKTAEASGTADSSTEKKSEVKG